MPVAPVAPAVPVAPADPVTPVVPAEPAAPPEEITPSTVRGRVPHASVVTAQTTDNDKPIDERMWGTSNRSWPYIVRDTTERRRTCLTEIARRIGFHVVLWSMRLRIPTLTVSLAFIAACGGGNPGQGGVKQACYPNGTCNSGLTCLSMVCVDAQGTGGASGGGGANATDAASGGGGASTTDASDSAGSGGAIAGATGQAGGSGENGQSGTSGAAGSVPNSDASSDIGDASDSRGDGTPTDQGPIDSTADVPRFAVLALPGLLAWFDAAKNLVSVYGHPDQIGGWEDQSANMLFAGVTDSIKPLLVQAGVNGLPFISLDNTKMIVPGTLKLDFGQYDFLIEVVARWNSQLAPPADLLQIISPTGVPSTNFALFGDAAGHAAATLMGATTVTSASSGLGNEAFHLVGARRYGNGASATLEVRVNGAVDGTMTGSTYGLDLLSYASAQLGPGSNLGIAEIVIVRGAVTDADLRTLEGYLISKYAL